MSPYRLLYSALLFLLAPLMVVRLLWKSRSTPAYRQRIGERFGILPRRSQPVKIWLHAVSVGEAIAAKPLVDALLEAYGADSLLMTTTTPTGAETVARMFDGQLEHRYFPYDLPGVTGAYLKQIKPELLLIMETEIWPNLWSVCRARSVPVVMVNARLSEKAMLRYQKVSWLLTDTLAKASFIGCRNQQDVTYFEQLGAPQEVLREMGDLKLDVNLDPVWQSRAEQLRTAWGVERKVWVAASTHEGEDQAFLAMHRHLLEQDETALLILVPRHPERFGQVAGLIADSGFSYARRSGQNAYGGDTQVILGDSMGEMLLWYCAADVVVMGGSLVETGGHNPVEPLLAGTPVLSGPHIFNFVGIFALFEGAGLRVCPDQTSVQKCLLEWLHDPELRAQQVELSREILKRNQGATQRYMQLVQALLLGR